MQPHIKMEFVVSLIFQVMKLTTNERKVFSFPPLHSVTVSYCSLINCSFKFNLFCNVWGRTIVKWWSMNGFIEPNSSKWRPTVHFSNITVLIQCCAKSHSVKTKSKSVVKLVVFLSFKMCNPCSIVLFTQLALTFLRSTSFNNSMLHRASSLNMWQMKVKTGLQSNPPQLFVSSGHWEHSDVGLPR